MITKYSAKAISKAMNEAKYEIIDDKEPYYGEIPSCRGAWAIGRTMKECKQNLRSVLKEWIRLKR
jgi:predicted RNase H-like HicB family nuclease